MSLLQALVTWLELPEPLHMDTPLLRPIAISRYPAFSYQNENERLKLPCKTMNIYFVSICILMSQNQAHNFEHTPASKTPLNATLNGPGAQCRSKSMPEAQHVTIVSCLKQNNIAHFLCAKPHRNTCAKWSWTLPKSEAVRADSTEVHFEEQHSPMSHTHPNHASVYDRKSFNIPSHHCSSLTCSHYKWADHFVAKPTHLIGPNGARQSLGFSSEVRFPARLRGTMQMGHY